MATPKSWKPNPVWIRAKVSGLDTQSGGGGVARSSPIEHALEFFPLNFYWLWFDKDPGALSRRCTSQTDMLLAQLRLFWE